MRTLLAFISVSLLAAAQDNKNKPVQMHPKVDQQKVDEAIDRGCKYLLSGGYAFGTFGHGKRNQPEAMQGYGELVLLTLLHSGYYKEGDAVLGPIVDHVLQKQITSTYTASLHAMALQKLNPRKHQLRIAECAQFLVDNQCENGQWDYGAPDPAEKDKPPVPTSAGKPARADVATSGSSGTGTSGTQPPATPKKDVGKTSALPKIPVRKKKPGPPNGDNSNSQYAALGLRACLDAGIDIEARVLTQARKWWLSSQNGDGGWGYNGEGSLGGGDENETGVSNTSYGSMTVGAVGGLCIYDYYLGIDYKGDGAVKKGFDWLTKNYDVTKNPKKKDFADLYYLYGLERLGMLYGTERIGPNEWYPDGAVYLLSTQQGGTWAGDSLPRETHVNTCFAILFLRRGTAPLRPVATAGGRDPAMGKPVANAGGGAANAPAEGGGAAVPVSKDTEAVAPGWKLSGSTLPGGMTNPLSARGKQTVVATYPAGFDRPAVFRRTTSLPEGKSTLKLIVGHEEGSSWTLQVRVDTKDVFTKVIGPDTAKEGWLETDVDLSKFGGKGEVLLELFDIPGAGRGTKPGYWALISLK